MNLLKQIIYMRENIDISCKRFQEMLIYSFSGQIKYEDFFHNKDIKRCRRTTKRKIDIFLMIKKLYSFSIFLYFFEMIDICFKCFNKYGYLFYF